MSRLLGTFALLFAAYGQDGSLVVDRGLPKANWNDAAGITSRSNVRWTLYSQGFVGDDFTLGQPGERWVVNTVRVWAVPGAYDTDPATLGDVYQDVRLYIGAEGEDLTPVATGRFSRGSNEVSGADIAISEAGNVPLYENFGTHYKIYQVEFRNLNLTVQGGVRYRFGAWGLGRANGEKGEIYPWFTHGSNATLGEASADGADGKLLLFEAAGRYAREYDANGAAWNKSSDLNVQIFAQKELDSSVRVTADGSVEIPAAGLDPASLTWNGKAAAESFVRNGVTVARFEGLPESGRLCVSGRTQGGQAVRACGAR